MNVLDHQGSGSDARPRLRITMHIEIVDRWDRPTGTEQWIQGLAQHVPGGGPEHWEHRWISDSEGRYYTITVTDPERSTR